MEYRNLDQLRAANAIQYKDTTFEGADGGGVVKKVPTMIRENGFLGALAFALERKKKGERKNPGHYQVFECVVEHLKSLKRISASNPDDLFKELTEADSVKLRDVTAESLLYLNYLRRFAKPAEKEDKK